MQRLTNPIPIDPASPAIMTAVLTRPPSRTPVARTKVRGQIEIAKPLDELPKGIYRLTVTTACGCWTADYWHECPPSRQPATHTPTPTYTVDPCCGQEPPQCPPSP